MAQGEVKRLAISCPEFLRGEEVLRLGTRGKALLTHFANDYSVYSHNPLYEVWKTRRRGKMPKTNRSPRLLLNKA